MCVSSFEYFVACATLILIIMKLSVLIDGKALFFENMILLKPNENEMGKWKLNVKIYKIEMKGEHGNGCVSISTRIKSLILFFAQLCSLEGGSKREEKNR